MGKALTVEKTIHDVKKPPRGRPRVTTKVPETVAENDEEADQVRPQASTKAKQETAKVANNSVVEKIIFSEGQLNFDQFTKLQGSTNDAISDAQSSNASLFQFALDRTLSAMSSTVNAMSDTVKDTVRSTHLQSKYLYL